MGNKTNHKHKLKYLGPISTQAHNELEWQCVVCHKKFRIFRWDVWPRREDRIINYDISGIGRVTIDIPNELTDFNVAELVNEAIVKTMDLLRPVVQAQRFHPVLGYGGYSG